MPIVGFHHICDCEVIVAHIFGSNSTCRQRGRRIPKAKGRIRLSSREDLCNLVQYPFDKVKDDQLISRDCIIWLRYHSKKFLKQHAERIGAASASNKEPAPNQSPPKPDAVGISADEEHSGERTHGTTEGIGRADHAHTHTREDNAAEIFYSPAATHGPTSAASTPNATTSPATVWHSGSAGLGTPLQDAAAAVTPGTEAGAGAAVTRGPATAAAAAVAEAALAATPTRRGVEHGAGPRRSEGRRPMGRHALGSPLGKRARGDLSGGVGAGSPHPAVHPAVQLGPADVPELHDAFSPPGLLLQLQSPDGDAPRDQQSPAPWPGGDPHPTPKSASTPPSQRSRGRLTLPRYRPRDFDGGDVGASVTASPSAGAAAAAAAPGPVGASGRDTPPAGAAGPTSPWSRDELPAAAIAHGNAGDGGGSGAGAGSAAGAAAAAGTAGTPCGSGGGAGAVAGRSPCERAAVNTRLMRLNTKFQRQQRTSLAEAGLAATAAGAAAAAAGGPGAGEAAAARGEGLGSRGLGGPAELFPARGGAAVAPQEPQQGQQQQRQQQAQQQEQQEQEQRQGRQQEQRQEQGQRQPPQQQQRAPVVVVNLLDEEPPSRRQPALPRRRTVVPVPVVIDLVDSD